MQAVLFFIISDNVYKKGSIPPAVNTAPNSVGKQWFFSVYLFLIVPECIEYLVHQGLLKLRE